MANYDLNHIPSLRDLQDLAKRQNAKHKALDSRVNALENIGAQANKIERIKVNGTEQTIGSDKSVNITVPTNTSQLNNDSTFQTSAQVVEAINTAISKSGHASFQKVDALDTTINSKITDRIATDAEVKNMLDELFGA